MNRPIDIRNWWSEYGLWMTALICMESYWLGTRGSTLVGWLAPVSIVASAKTALHLATARAPALRFWRTYVVKWLSWWIANYVATVLVLYSVFGIFWGWQLSEGERSLLLASLVIPMIRLVQHAWMDIQDFREGRHYPNAGGRSAFGK